MKIERTNKKISVLLNNENNDFLFIDGFQTVFYSPKQITSKELGKAFFTSAPKWVDLLFLLRNKLMGFVGLKVAGSKEEMLAALDNFSCLPGEKIGLFKVYAVNENEVVLGEDDTHLDFRISLLIDSEGEVNKKLTISTSVKCNNSFGRIYFYAIKPFHKIIVPIMLRGMIDQLNKK